MIELIDKLKSKTLEGKVCDYAEVDGVPIIEADLTATTLTANTYYKHTGATGTYTTGVIYYYNGSSLKPIDGSGSGGEGGLGEQEVEDIVDGRLEHYVMIQALEEARYDLSEYGFAKSTTVEQLSNIVQDLDQITIPEIENQMVKTVKVGETSYTPTNGVVSLPAYPTGTGGGNVVGGTKTISITLSPSDWVDNTQTVSVSDVTADSKVVVSPEGNPRPFSEAGIYCSESGEGALTFVCETVPTREINVSVFVVSPTQISSAVRVTLLADNWNGTTQEVAVEGLTRSNSVVVSPYGNPRNYANSWIYCSVQLEGKLLFNCEIIPTMDIEVNVLIL